MSPVAAAQTSLGLTEPSATVSAEGQAPRLIRAAGALLAVLERGQAIDARALREAMTDAFGATDSDGAWVWKDAYEACEVAQLLFLRRYLPAMRGRATGDAQLLGMVGRVAALTPTHTRRSEESVALQQFSTPLELGLVASIAARITADDPVLEPSAGTGQLALFAESLGARLVLNEIADTRADLLASLFPATPPTRFNAEQIHDYLPAEITPSVVVMNPPFSATPNVKGRIVGADSRHVRSALQRLAPGGRLVAITGAGFAPGDDLAALGTVVFSAPIAGSLYRRHGTNVETRLTVIDRVPADDTPQVVAAHPMAETAQALLDLVIAHVPERRRIEVPSRTVPRPSLFARAPRIFSGTKPPRQRPASPSSSTTATELAYGYVEPDAPSDAPIADTLYELCCPCLPPTTSCWPSAPKRARSPGSTTARPRLSGARPASARCRPGDGEQAREVFGTSSHAATRRCSSS